jgi:hypothetical protein
MRFFERIIQIALSQKAAQIATFGWAFHSSQRMTVSIMFLFFFPVGVEGEEVCPALIFKQFSR